MAVFINEACGAGGKGSGDARWVAGLWLLAADAVDTIGYGCSSIAGGYSPFLLFHR